MELSDIDQESLQVFFKFCWGLDGSGEHSDYHQLTKVGFTTKQLMSVCFTLREVKVVDSLGHRVDWNSKVAGSNKPQNTRPLALFPAKESKELLQEFVPLVEAEVVKVRTEGVQVHVGGRIMTADCHTGHLSMADGKMITTLLQLGGAYCTMCKKSAEECQKLETIEAGFIIERSVESLKELALSLTDPDTSDVMKK